MNTIERAIYIGLIALMVGVVSLDYYSAPTQQIEKIQTKSQPPSQPEMKTPAFIKLNIGNGYVLHYDAKDEPLYIEKTPVEGKPNYVSMEIASEGRKYSEYMNEIFDAEKKIPKLYDGPNGWKYYKVESWDPAPKMNQEGWNISKVFIKELCDNVFTVTQNDYTGGKYDKEVERWVSKIEIVY